MFLLEAVLDSAAPPLEIVDQPSPPPVDIPIVDRILLDSPNVEKVETDFSIEEKPKKFEVPAALRNGAKRKRRRRRDGSSRDSSSSRSRRDRPDNSAQRPVKQGESIEAPVVGEVNEITADKAIDDVKAPAFSESMESTESKSAEKRAQGVRTRPRRKKKQSGGMEVMKVVIGGMLAIPISQLLLWWFLHFDPLNTAPMVEKVVPALVPVKLRAPRNDSPDSPNEAFNTRPPEDADIVDPRRDNGGDLDTPETDPTRLLRIRNRNK